MDLVRTLALLSLATPALAGTLTVGPTGSGAAYDDIADAIAAALPGDTILIEPGAYVDATPLVVDKPLTILGSGSAVTSFEAVAAFPFDQPLPLLVRDLGPGDEVRIAGLSLASHALGGFVASSVVVVDCDGPVVLADVASTGPAPGFQTPGLAQVRNSGQVLLDRCRFDAQGGTDQTTPALYLENAVVHLNDSELLGGDAGLGLSAAPPAEGAPALVAVASTVRLSRSDLRGGDGTASSPFTPTVAATDGGPAVLATGSTVIARGGTGSQLIGGTGGFLLTGGTPLVGLGGHAVEYDAGSLLAMSLGAQLLPGLDGDGGLTQLSIGGAGSWFLVSTPLATLGVDASLVAPGGVVNLELIGESNGVALTWFALTQDPALVVPGIHGEILLSIAGAVPLTTQALDLVGHATLPVPIPAVPALVGTTALVQSFMTGPSGEASCSAPVFVGVR